MPFESIEAARRATPAEIEAHFIETEAANSRWAHLEYQRRIAERRMKELLLASTTETTPEKRELLAIVILLGAVHIVLLEDAKNFIAPKYPEDLASYRRDAEFWIAAIREIYVGDRLTDLHRTMLAALEAARDYFVGAGA